MKMNKKEKSEIEKILKSRDEPTGVIVRSADGRVFFLSHEDAKRTRVSREGSSLYLSYLLLSQFYTQLPMEPIPTTTNDYPCKAVGEYLWSHDPASEQWNNIYETWKIWCPQDQAQ